MRLNGLRNRSYLRRVRRTPAMESQNRVPGLPRRFGVAEQIEMAFVDHAFVGEKTKVDHLLPIGPVVEHDRNLLHPPGLAQRQGVEQLVQRAETAGKNHQRFRPQQEMHLSQGKVMKLEAKLR